MELCAKEDVEIHHAEPHYCLDVENAREGEGHASDTRDFQLHASASEEIARQLVLTVGAADLHKEVRCVRRRGARRGAWRQRQFRRSSNDDEIAASVWQRGNTSRGNLTAGQASPECTRNLFAGSESDRDRQVFSRESSTLSLGTEDSSQPSRRRSSNLSQRSNENCPPLSAFYVGHENIAGQVPSKSDEHGSVRGSQRRSSEAQRLSLIDSSEAQRLCQIDRSEVASRTASRSDAVHEFVERASPWADECAQLVAQMRLPPTPQQFIALECAPLPQFGAAWEPWVDDVQSSAREVRALGHAATLPHGSQDVTGFSCHRGARNAECQSGDHSCPETTAWRPLAYPVVWSRHALDGWRHVLKEDYQRLRKTDADADQRQDEQEMLEACAFGLGFYFGCHESMQACDSRGEARNLEAEHIAHKLAGRFRDALLADATVECKFEAPELDDAFREDPWALATSSTFIGNLAVRGAEGTPCEAQPYGEEGEDDDPVAADFPVRHEADGRPAAPTATAVAAAAAALAAAAAGQAAVNAAAAAKRACDDAQARLEAEAAAESEESQRRIVMRDVPAGGAGLHFAAGNGRLSALRVLLESLRVEAVNQRGEDNFTVLHTAARAGHAEIITALLDHPAFVVGSNLDVGWRWLSTLTTSTDIPQDAWGGSALHVAVACDNVLAAGELVRHEGFEAVDAVTEDGWTALHMAAWLGRASIASLLLASPRFTVAEALHRNAATALHFAAYRGHSEVVSILLGSPRFDAVDVQAEDGSTALHCAAMGGHSKAASLLLESPRFTLKAVANAINGTALHTAVDSGQIEVARVLLQSPFFEAANTLTAAGGTALQVAALRGHAEIASLLLESPSFTMANFNSPAMGTALHVAADHGHAGVAAVLLRSPAFEAANATTRDLSSAMHAAARRGHAAVVSELLAAPRFSCSFAGNASDITPLHVAAAQGHREAVKRLLADKRCVMARDAAGRTALHYAALHGQAAAVDAILSSRRFRNAAQDRNVYGGTAMHDGAEGGHEAVILRLLKTERKIQAVKDKLGHTAFDVARRRGHTVVQELLA